MTKASAVPARRSKYGAVPTVMNGIRFASRKEARRWQELQLLEKAGEIRDLERQVPFVLCAVDEYGAAVKIGDMVIDFGYFDARKDEWTLEDTKGFVTPLWRWKQKHFTAQYGRKIRET